MLDQLKQYYSTVKGLIRYKNKAALDLFKAENLYERFDDHDNWNRGIDFYSIEVYIPTSKFAEIDEERRKKMAEDITKSFQDATLNNDSIQINGTFIVPRDDENLVVPTSESMWKLDYFRLFISHLSENKTTASNLQTCLLDWGIYGFVAHKDIEPSKEWANELYNALFTMDALCAILVKNFRYSRWCDQEIGIALGQNKLCIPINKEINPYGFLGHYQALKAHNVNCQFVAESIAEIIFNNEKTHNIYCRSIVRLLLNSKDSEAAVKWFDVFSHFDKIEKIYVELLWKDFAQNGILLNPEILGKANKLFKEYGLSSISSSSRLSYSADSELLPF